MSKFRPSGGYRATCSFQTATIIYDATYWFCEKFLDSRLEGGCDTRPPRPPIQGVGRILETGNAPSQDFGPASHRHRLISLQIYEMVQIILESGHHASAARTAALVREL